MASGIARTVKVTHAPTGRVYWAEKRVGFNGVEYNFGAGWKRSRIGAYHAAEQAGELREVQAGGEPR